MKNIRELKYKKWRKTKRSLSRTLFCRDHKVTEPRRELHRDFRARHDKCNISEGVHRDKKKEA